MQFAMLAVAAGLGYFGYRHAEQFERQYGRSPGGGSAAVWGFVCFLLGLIGVLVLYLAENSTKKKVQASSVVWTASPYGAPPAPYGAPAEYGMPRYAAPVAPPAAPAAAPPAGQWSPPPPPGQWAPPPPPPGPWTPPVEPRPNVGGSEFLPGRKP
jgi:hypothetical protein